MLCHRKIYLTVLHPGICPHASAAAVLTIVVVPQLSFVMGRGEEEFCKVAFFYQTILIKNGPKAAGMVLV